MTITLTSLLLWLVIAAIVGVVGEFIARRRSPDGFVGATLLGFLAIFLVVGVFKFHIAGEPTVGDGVPLFSSILAAALIVLLWSGIGYRRVYRPRYERYYRRGTYARRPRRRWRLF